MRPVRTPLTNAVYRPAEGDEEYVEPMLAEAKPHDEIPSIVSTWELSDEDREKLSQGGHIELGITGISLPPVGMAVVAPFDGDERMEWSEELKSFVHPTDEP